MIIKEQINQNEVEAFKRVRSSIDSTFSMYPIEVMTLQNLFGNETFTHDRITTASMLSIIALMFFGCGLIAMTVYNTSITSLSILVIFCFTFGLAHISDKKKAIRIIASHKDDIRILAGFWIRNHSSFNEKYECYDRQLSNVADFIVNGNQKPHVMYSVCCLLEDSYCGLKNYKMKSMIDQANF